jgi:hypothetical protein
MEVELKTLSIAKSLNSGLARWDLDKADTGMLGLSWEGGVDKAIAARGPH